MAQLLDPVDDRILAILTAGHGTSGCGADAATRALPAGIFHAPTTAVRLDRLEASTDFDRAVAISWTSSGDTPDPVNQQDNVQLRQCVFRLHGRRPGV